MVWVIFKQKLKILICELVFFNVADDDYLYNVFISKCINKISHQTETELNNLSNNDSTDPGSLKFKFGIYNTRDEQVIKKYSFKSARKSARPKFLLRR